MSRPIPAIVESALAPQIAAVRAAAVALRKAEAHEAEAEQRATSAREDATKRRLALGKALCTARAAWPRSGPNARGWGEFLAREGIEERSARRYMELAGWTQREGDDERPDPTEQAEQRQDQRERDGFSDTSRLVSENSDPEPGPVTTPVPSEGEVIALAARLDPDARGRVMRSLRSSQASENVGDRDAYCTPPEVTAALPEVDLDPCSNEHSTVRAGETYCLEAGEDGLESPWFGVVYVNPPYSKPLPWAEKLDAERPNIVAAGFLVNADHSPRWWHVLKRHLPIRLDFDERIEFTPPPGVEPSKNDRPQTLLMDEAFWAECDQAALLAMGTLWRQESSPPEAPVDVKGGDVSLDEPA